MPSLRNREIHVHEVVVVNDGREWSDSQQQIYIFQPVVLTAIAFLNPRFEAVRTISSLVEVLMPHFSFARGPVRTFAAGVGFWVWVLPALILLSSLNVEAQTNSLVDEGSTPVAGVGHNYIYGISETVSPSDGTVNLNINLPTPPGRGLSFPFGITYNSGAVHRFTSQIPGCGGLDQHCASTPWTTGRTNLGAGWSDTLPYTSAVAWTVPIYPGNTGGYGSGEAYGCGITSSYNFYDLAGNGHPLNLAGISLPGVIAIEAPPLGCTNIPVGSFGYSSSQSGGDDYVTAVAEANCNGYPGQNAHCPAPSFTVTDSAGTKYFFPAQQIYTDPTLPSDQTLAYFAPSSIEDRNGNTISFTGPSDSVYYGLPITDTAGRQLIAASTSAGPVVGAYPYGATSYTVGGLVYNLAYTTATAWYTSKSLQVEPIAGANCITMFSVNGEKLQVVSSIKAPNGSSYQFKYDGTYGLVDEIDYPDGGWVKYTWKLSDTLSQVGRFSGVDGTTSSVIVGGCTFEYQTPVVATRTVGYSPGSAAAQTQAFTYNTTWNSMGNWTSKTTTVVTTDNVTGQQFTTIYTYGSVGAEPQVNDFTATMNQIPVESSVKYYGTTSTNTTPMETVTKTWDDPYQMTSEIVQFAGGSSAEQVNCYSSGSIFVNEKDEYDYGVTGQTLSTPQIPTCGSPTPTRKTTYGGYEISGIPCQTVVYDSSGNRAAETDVYLDGGSTPCISGAASTVVVTGLPTGTHDETNYGPSVKAKRGNPTTVVKWLNTGTSVTATATYDETGQMISSTDSCGNGTCSDVSGANHTTTYSYSDNPGMEMLLEIRMRI